METWRANKELGDVGLQVRLVSDLNTSRKTPVQVTYKK